MSVDLGKTDIEGLLRLYSNADSRLHSAQYIDDFWRSKIESDEAKAQMLAIRQEIESRCRNSGEAA